MADRLPTIPVIAVTVHGKRNVDDYLHSVRHAGGEERLVDAAMGVDAALDGVAGVILTGGLDVNPSRYGETPHPTVVQVSADRDAFELGVAAEARRRGVPLLAICRGAQVLNVVAGGSLVQDIPSQITGALEHSYPVPANEAFRLAHEIEVEEDSLLARLMGEMLAGGDTLMVNSRHHQAVRQLAPGLRTVAVALDGVIEAIEDPAARYCLGVQWHPENFWRTGEFRALFEGLLMAARQ